MTVGELEEYAMKMPHAGITNFYWYNGELLQGRIVMGYGEVGTFSHQSYYFISNEHYNPRNHETNNIDNFKKNGRLIVDQDCIEVASNVQYIGNNDPIDLPDRKKIRKLIIIGAGASYDFDSRPEGKHRFPLTNNLFKEGNTIDIGSYSGAMALQNDLSIVSNVEHYFQRKWTELANTYDSLLLSELISIQYFLHELFFLLSNRYRSHALNNFNTLANAIQTYTKQHPDEHVGLISYNYDTMLESALENKFRFQYQHLTDYFAPNRPFVLFKPHGSSNWVRRFQGISMDNGQWKKHLNTNGPQIRYDLENNPRVIELLKAFSESKHHSVNDIANHFDKGVFSLATIQNSLYPNIEIAKEEEKLIVKGGVRDYMRTSMPYFPQLLIPYKDKDDFVMPRNHTRLLDRVLPEVQEILIIGWKGEENMMLKKLQQFLGHKEVKITWVDGPKSEAESRSESDTEREGIPSINGVLPKASWVVKPIGFSGFAREIAEETDGFFR